MYQLLGLNLLSLLAQNRLAEFHTVSTVDKVHRENHCSHHGQCQFECDSGYDCHGQPSSFTLFCLGVGGRKVPTPISTFENFLDI